MTKKYFILFTCFILVAGLLTGRTFKITNPVSKTVLTKGDQLNITWQKLAKMNGFVKIRLFNSNGTQKILELTNKTANKGSFKWTYIGNVKDGDYKIRVRTVDNKDSGDSQTFTIGKKSSPPPPPPPPPPTEKIFSVTYPNGSETLSKNNPNSLITWKAEHVTGQISIELWKGSRKYGTIGNNIPVNQKQFKWIVGNTFGNTPAGAGSDYRIRISGNGLEDLSDKYFTISDIPGLVSNPNNIGNTIHTFQNPPQEKFTLAVPPVIEEIKVWSTNEKFRGQVVYGDDFDIKVKLKNVSKSINKNDWRIRAKIGSLGLSSQLVQNSKNPRKPGESWWHTMTGVPSKRNLFENKSGFHILTVTLGNSSKSTMIGIIKKEEITLPQIKSFFIWNNQYKSWSTQAIYKPGTQYKLQLNVVNVYKYEIVNKNTGRVLATTYPPSPNGIKDITLTAYDTGDIEVTANSTNNRYTTATVKLKTSGPLTLDGNYLKFDMWRSGQNVKTKGLVSGYRTVKFVEVYPSGKERLLKEIKALTPNESSKLEWEFFQVGFPLTLRLKVAYWDYSKEEITRTLR